MSRIKILVVEDDPIISMDVAEQLENLDYEVVSQCYDAESAIRELGQYTLDLVILDIDLGGQQDGVDVAHYINRHLGLPFIFLTAYADRTTLNRVKETKPAAYIIKPFDQKDLLANIEIALYNHAQNDTRILIPERINAGIHTPLTEREFEILKMIYDGASNRKIAQQLFVSNNTVKTHIKSIYLKMEVNSRSNCLIKVRTLLS